MLKRFLLVFILILNTSFAKDIHIVFISAGADMDPFWSTIKNGFEDAGKELQIKTDYRNSSTGDLTELARLLQAAISQRPDGIIVTLRDKNSLSKEIKKAKELSIPIINVNSGQAYTKELNIMMYIGSNEYQAGFEAGKKAKAAGVKSFVCVNQVVNNVIMEQRCQGFADALGTKMIMIDSGFEPTEIQKRVSAYLGKVDALLTLGSANADPIISLLQTKKLDKKPYFVTFDLSQKITQAIKEDTIAFAIDQQPYLQGYLPVIFLDKYIRYGIIPSEDEIYTGPAFVTKDNVKQVEKFAGQYR